jgi:vacuolar-type H+-ATPase subunit E/Vma4
VQRSWKTQKKRLAEAARKKHIAEMNALAQREEQAWEAVDQLLSDGCKIASVYNNATAQLKKLAQLAEFKQPHPVFQSRIQALAEKYARRSALIGRWKREGWV